MDGMRESSMVRTTCLSSLFATSFTQCLLFPDLILFDRLFHATGHKMRYISRGQKQVIMVHLKSEEKNGQRNTHYNVRDILFETCPKVEISRFSLVDIVVEWTEQEDPDSTICSR